MASYQRSGLSSNIEVDRSFEPRYHHVSSFRVEVFLDTAESGELDGSMTGID